MRTLIWSTLLALIACSGGSNDTNPESDTDTDADTDADTDSDTDADDWDATGDPTREADETFTGDLADGSVISLDWADDSPLYCWVGSENSNFTGNHVFYVVEKGGEDNVAVAVDPASGVDVSMYLLEFASTGDIQYPPDINDAARCEAAFDYQNDGNPGKKELFLMQGPGTGDRVLLLGVAGADGQTSGAFTVKVWRGDVDGYAGPK
jgi:hypothetical protein